MSNSRDEISIYSYHDYRLFLKDRVSWLKTHRKLSMRGISKKAGFSHGYLSLVLKCQRNLSQKMLEKIAPILEMTEAETDYFKKLITLGDSPSPKERNQAFKALKLSDQFKEQHSNEFATHKYLEKWYYVAIRELAILPNFQNDPEWIRKKLPFPIRTHEVVEALDFLSNHGFVVINDDGELTVTEKDIRCSGGVFQLSLGNFHRNMLGMAQDGLTRFNKENRKQIGYTTGISKEDFDQVKLILEEAKQKIVDLEKKSKKEKNAVYHINLTAFPIAGEGFSK